MTEIKKTFRISNCLVITQESRTIKIVIKNKPLNTYALTCPFGKLDIMMLPIMILLSEKPFHQWIEYCDGNESTLCSTCHLNCMQLKKAMAGHTAIAFFFLLRESLNLV